MFDEHFLFQFRIIFSNVRTLTNRRCRYFFPTLDKSEENDSIEQIDHRKTFLFLPLQMNLFVVKVK